MRFEQYFPNLRSGSYRLTSPAASEYNCIAWAAHDQEQWWWPDAMGQAYWPEGVAREETIDAFERAYGSVNFAPCENADPEPGFEKVAIYAKRSRPTHAARQLADGRWTGKLGPLEDIEHNTLDALEGQVYGRVVLLLKRPLG